jgi:hypothetical protein
MADIRKKVFKINFQKKLLTPNFYMIWIRMRQFNNVIFLSRLPLSLSHYSKIEADTDAANTEIQMQMGVSIIQQIKTTNKK